LTNIWKKYCCLAKKSDNKLSKLFLVILASLFLKLFVVYSEYKKSIYIDLFLCKVAVCCCLIKNRVYVVMKKIIFLLIVSLECFGSSRLVSKILRSGSVINPWGKLPLYNPIEKAEGPFIYIGGYKYISVSSGLVNFNFGHANPKIISAKIAAQSLPNCQEFDVPGRTELTQRLLDKSKISEGGAFWCNTGSEANNLLRRSALLYHNYKGNSEKTKIATMKESFHGAIGDVRNMTRDGRTSHFASSGETSDFLALPAPKKGQEEETLSEIKKIILENNEQLAAILLPGHGGSGEAAGRDWPEIADLYHEISNLCQEYDILLFWDCVMSGGGRIGGDASGNGYFATDNYKVEVNGRSLSKSLTAGHGASGLAMFDAKVAEAINYMGCDWGTTTAGQHEAIAAATAVLNMTEENDHQVLRHIRDLGNLWTDELAPQLLENFPEIVLQANGTGLLQALLIDKSVDLTRLKEALIKRGLVVFVMRRKLDDNIVMMITPPFIIKEQDLYSIFYGVYSVFMDL
jgi:acetylornithine/N-succinyldiaminopimelate aminotransferase